MTFLGRLIIGDTKSANQLWFTLALVIFLFFGCASQNGIPGTGTPPGNGESTREAPQQLGKSGSEAAPAAPPGDKSEEDSEKISDEFEDEMAAELDKEFAEKELDEVSDPFSGYNRSMTVFNDKLYTWVLDPAGRGLRFVLPEYSRRGIANFFDNLLYPLRLINNLLQAKFANSGEETLRFVTNTTIGVFGLWDPADKWFGLEAHDEDFGQTLGYWGVGPGPHIVLPFLGPSNLRDMFALVPDYYLDPATYYIDSEKDQLALRVFKEVNKTSLHIGEYENLKRDALDLYPFLRDVYEQNRAKLILE
ncbi:MAG: MlaA family lipoprotein [SAR324 cluster bacterium]|nr:MlaA family lipoprotein [SAR324 cluster bacterium]